jgi:predicted Rossmann fold flavoprotein
VVTTGGKAAPKLGGADSGIAALKKLGHAVTPVYPALVPLIADAPFMKQLKGTRAAAKAGLEVGGKVAASVTGEILFTDYGLSGIPIMQLSLTANRALYERKPVMIRIDLFPDFGAAQLVDHLHQRFSSRPETPLEQALIGLAHKRLITPLLRSASFADLRAPARAVTEADIQRLASTLKSWPFRITGSLGWNDAQVMAGGIATAEFSPTALESRIVKGLFAAGEVLDMAGDCGGFNLQWAWSSGHVAGLHAARAE